jgi:hypothetical protein
MPEITAVTREEGLVTPPRTQPRKRRSGVVAFGVVSALGLGVAGGVNLHRLVDLDQTVTWLRQAESLLQSGFEAARAEVGRRIESLTTKPGSVAQASVAQASREAAAAPPNPNEGLERTLADLTLRVDQVRAAAEGSARDLGAGIERVQGSTDQNHRDLVAKLSQLADRLERVERQAVAAATPAVVQPVAQQTATPLAKPAAKPVPQPAPDAKPKANPKQSATEAKPGGDVRGIANWTVREVLNGTAVLQGPRGLVEVSPGDTIPGIGQVQAIMRSGRRWVVATTKGVITPH